jgi:hypothetical protein
MNWTQFILWLSLAYFIYYLLNLLFDLLRPRSKSAENSGLEELTFSEEHEPETVVENDVQKEEKKLQALNPNNRQAISSGPISATGGVSLKQLFFLAQSDLIEFTKTIPY